MKTLTRQNSKQEEPDLNYDAVTVELDRSIHNFLREQNFSAGMSTPTLLWPDLVCTQVCAP